MFHTILTVSYIIPAVYIFLRIWSLFILKEWRKWYIIIYSLLFLIYPLSNLIGENGNSHGTIIISTAANYLLPFFLYMFLLILSTDLILLINLGLSFISKEKLLNKTFKTRYFFSIICISVIVEIGGIINFNFLRTSEFHVDVRRKASDVSNLKIAFVSDFHLEEGTPVHFVKSFLNKIYEIKPDILFFGGDIVEGNSVNENMIQFENILNSIRTRYGVFGVLGNHEHYSRQDNGSFFNRSGIRILSDSIVIIGNSFIIAGRNDSHIMRRKSVEQLLKGIPDSLPVILLDHRPTDIDEVTKSQTDIQLSGHTHNGQLFPINLITNKIYKLDYG